MASNRAPRSSLVCKKCQRPVRGHVGPTGSSCSQPSPQFITDTSSSILPVDLANIQQELEASIREHEDQINNLSAELGTLRLNSTPATTQQHSNFAPTTGFAMVSAPGWPTSLSTAPPSYVSKMAAKEKATSFPPVTVVPPQFASFVAAQPPQPQGFPAVPARVPASSNTQVVGLLQQLLQQFQNPGLSVPSAVQPSSSLPPTAPASRSDRRQNSMLKHQADQRLRAIPI